MKSKDKPLESLLKLIVEAGLLKRTRRSGWSVVGVSNPESVADHSFRCALIAYLIARFEGADSHKALIMSLFNDIHEARITDLHKMAQRYIDSDKAEDQAFFEQIEELPFSLKNELSGMRNEYRKQKSKESKIARDADILECLIQAKEYYESGYKLAKKFMVKAPDFLETKSARRLWEKIEKTNLNDWWQALSQFKR